MVRPQTVDRLVIEKAKPWTERQRAALRQEQGRRAPDGGAAVGDLEHETGVDDAQRSMKRSCCSRWLAGPNRSYLPAGRLADPPRHTQAPDVVERARQALHAAPASRFASMATTFARTNPVAKSVDRPAPRLSPRIA